MGSATSLTLQPYFGCQFSFTSVGIRFIALSKPVSKYNKLLFKYNSKSITNNYGLLSMAKLNYTQFDSYSEFFNQWHWQWFTTLTFEPKINQDLILQLRLNWTRQLCKIDQIQIAYFYSQVNSSDHPHLHLLMLGTNKENKSLLDVNPSIWESAWPYRAQIFFPNSNIAVSKYLTKNITQINSEFDSYNLK